MRKITALLLGTLLVLGSIVVVLRTERVAGADVPAAPCAGGTGTVADPYIVQTLTELQNARFNPAANYSLANEIDAAATSTWNGGQGFIPIGEDSNRFTGSFEGNGHVITGLFINRPTASLDQGLFGFIGGAGAVRNLGLLGGDITAYNHVGGVAGTSYGSISDCFFSGDVAGNAAVGGSVGENRGASVNCYSAGSVAGSTGTGGFVGHNFGSAANCYSTSTVSGTGLDTGGFVGRNFASGTVGHCFSTGNVGGTGNNAGGFMGINDQGAVINCYSTGGVTNSGTTKGGFVGYNAAGAFTDCYSTGSITGNTNFVGGFVGYGDGAGTITNCYSTGTVSGGNNVGGFAGYLLNGGTVSGSYSTGNATGIESIGGFVGISDNTAISDCYCTGEATGTGDYVGGFGGFNVGPGSISASYCTGSAEGANYVGSFAGWSSGTIEYCYCTGEAGGDDEVGGFIGRNNGLVDNCHSANDATGTGDWVGGFAGTNDNGIITHSYATGTATGGAFVGGFVGYTGNWGTIAECYSTQNAIGSGNYVGGFAGYNSVNSNIENCSSAGSAGGNYNCGGFAGVNEGTIKCCYGTGNAVGVNNYVGGFVGQNTATVINCYGMGKAQGVWYVGGFVGTNGGGTITDCYSTGQPAGTSNVGGFAGSNAATVTACFWDTQTSGYPTSAAGTGRTTIQMQLRASFDPPWNFVNPWGIIDGNTYPFLTTIETIPPFTVDVSDIHFAPIITTSDFHNIAVVAEDAAYSFGFNSTAQPIPAGNKIESWTMSTDAGWLSLDQTGLVSGAPDNGDVGTYYVKLAVTDTQGAKGYFNYTVEVKNTLPVITTADKISVVCGSLYFNDYDSTDDGQGATAWTISTNAAWLTVVISTGTITGTPPNSDAGTYWVLLTVNDGNGGSDSTNFTLTVRLDTDYDGLPDSTDTDDDGDGTPDASDDFSLDPHEWLDTDTDGTGDNADTDDDGDGWSDIVEGLAGSDPLDPASEPGDADLDGIADFMDPDFLVTTVWNNQTIPEYHNTTVPEYHNSTVWNNQTIPEYHNTTVPEYHNSTVWNNGTVGSEAELPAWALGAIMAAIALSVVAVVLVLLKPGRKKTEEPEPKKPAE